MPEYWEKMLFDDTRERLGSGFANFLTADELKFIGRRADEMFVDFTRGVQGLDMEAAGALADFAKRYGSGDVPQTQEEIGEFRSALDKLGGNPGLPEEYRQHVQNLSKRLQNYTKTFNENSFGLQPNRLDSPIIDRSGFFGNRTPDPIEENIRKSGFDDFIRPDIDGLIGNVREEAKTRPFAANAPEETKQRILDDLIATFDANGLDSSWLRELKGANFLVRFQSQGDDEEYPGGMTISQDNGFSILMNAAKYPDYSDAMKVRLLHELRHVWQHLQDAWNPKFGDGISSKTDMDVEVDAHEMQFALERILGMKAGKTRKAFEGISNNPDEKDKKWAKTAYLYNYPYKEKKDRYKLNSLTTYETSDGK